MSASAHRAGELRGEVIRVFRIWRAVTALQVWEVYIQRAPGALWIAVTADQTRAAQFPGAVSALRIAVTADPLQASQF